MQTFYFSMTFLSEFVTVSCTLRNILEMLFVSTTIFIWKLCWTGSLLCNEKKRSTYIKCHKPFPCSTGYRHTSVHLHSSFLCYVMLSGLSSSLLLRNGVLSLWEDAFIFFIFKQFYITMKHGYSVFLAAQHWLHNYSQGLTKVSYIHSSFTFQVNSGRWVYCHSSFSCTYLFRIKSTWRLYCRGYNSSLFSQNTNKSQFSSKSVTLQGRHMEENNCLKAKLRVWATGVNSDFSIYFRRYRNSLLDSFCIF